MSLSPLIQHISQLAASGLDPAQVVDRGGVLILHTLAARRLSIRLYHEHNPVLASFDSGQPRLANENRGGIFVFSRPISVRGVEYGWLDLEMPAAAWSQPELQMAADLLICLFAQLAERDALLARHHRLLGESRDLAWRVKIEKLLTRAAGIVAAQRKIAPHAAIHWLRDESLRLRLPLWQIAERLIEGETLVRAFQSPHPPLRRTA